MAHAKLHLICGNCGCNDMWEFKIDETGHDITDTEPKFEPAVFLSCKNCTTLHDLSDNAKLTGMEKSMEMRAAIMHTDRIYQSSPKWR